MSVPSPIPAISNRTAAAGRLSLHVIAVYVTTPARSIRPSSLKMNNRYFSKFFITLQSIYECAETGDIPFPTHTLLTFHTIYCKKRAKPVVRRKNFHIRKVPGRGAFFRRALLKKDSSAEYQDFPPWQQFVCTPYIANTVPDIDKNTR